MVARENRVNTKTKLILIALVVVFLAMLWLLTPFWRGQAGGAVAATVSANGQNSAGATPQVAAPLLTPAALNPANATSPNWKSGGYLASNAWFDAGNNSPEDALQTILWTRKSNNAVRRMAISVTRQVNFNPNSPRDASTVHPPSSTLPSDAEALAALFSSGKGVIDENRKYVVLSSANTTMLVDPSTLDYSKLLGAKIISQTQTAPNTVSLEVEED